MLEEEFMLDDWDIDDEDVDNQEYDDYDEEESIIIRYFRNSLENED